MHSSPRREVDFAQAVVIAIGASVVLDTIVQETSAAAFTRTYLEQREGCAMAV
jgi:hypothetical protein